MQTKHCGLVQDHNTASDHISVRLPGEELGLRGVGGGGLDGLGGRSGLAGPDDTDGEPDLRLLGEDLCSVPSTAGELSLLCLRGATEGHRRPFETTATAAKLRRGRERERAAVPLGVIDGRLRVVARFACRAGREKSALTKVSKIFFNSKTQFETGRTHDFKAEKSFILFFLQCHPEGLRHSITLW